MRDDDSTWARHMVIARVRRGRISHDDRERRRPTPLLATRPRSARDRIPAMFSIQQLLPPDVPLLKQLLQVFGEAFDEVSTYQDQIPRDDYLASLLGRDHFIALVASDHGRIVGGLAAYELEKFERDLTVPAHFVFMVGTTEFSFDSRYWGPVSTDFVVGRVHVLW